MNKTQLVEKIAKAADISKAKADLAFKEMFSAITKSIKKGEDVTIFGFGTFSRVSYKAKMGVNPATGERIKIKARKAPKFKASKAFKELVNGKK